jgi:hypothetical protein
MVWRQAFRLSENASSGAFFYVPMKEPIFIVGVWAAGVLPGAV